MKRRLRICTFVGARPQFVKAAVVSRTLHAVGAEEVIIHTGQHYDPAMSQIFFDEMGIEPPRTNLGVGSAPHGTQTARMMIGIEEELAREPFDWVLVYGDTNSTLAAALVAAKMGIPVAHVEAGLRSYNRQMPEEINRVLTDHVSDRLFCPTSTAVENLRKEGITSGVVLAGDVMLDATIHFAERSARMYPLDKLIDFAPRDFYLATVHRAENTDNPSRFAAIAEAFGQLDRPVVWPVHPRTRPLLDRLELSPNVHLIEPVGYLAMLQLVRNAHAVLTDSGGVQKEAYWLGTPCITLRDETEWVETLAGGWNQLVGANPDAIISAVTRRPTSDRAPFGEPAHGTATELIAASLLEN